MIFKHYNRELSEGDGVGENFLIQLDIGFMASL